MCSNEPYKREKVQVFEYNKSMLRAPSQIMNRRFLVESDGFWGEVTTDDAGYFTLKMSGYDWFSVDPYVWIPNYCGQEVVDVGQMYKEQCTASCLRIEIPRAYITEGHVPKIVSRIGFQLSEVFFRHSTSEPWSFIISSTENSQASTESFLAKRKSAEKFKENRVSIFIFNELVKSSH